MTTAAVLDPSNRANQYPAYTQIRERGPLQLVTMMFRPPKRGMASLEVAI
jgi:hypothetical protein